MPTVPPYLASENRSRRQVVRACWSLLRQQCDRSFAEEMQRKFSEQFPDEAVLEFEKTLIALLQAQKPKEQVQEAVRLKMNLFVSAYTPENASRLTSLESAKIRAYMQETAQLDNIVSASLQQKAQLHEESAAKLREQADRDAVEAARFRAQADQAEAKIREMEAQIAQLEQEYAQRTGETGPSKPATNSRLTVFSASQDRGTPSGSRHIRNVR